MWANYKFAIYYSTSYKVCIINAFFSTNHKIQTRIVASFIGILFFITPSVYIKMILIVLLQGIPMNRTVLKNIFFPVVDFYFFRMDYCIVEHKFSFHKELLHIILKLYYNCLIV